MIQKLKLWIHSKLFFGDESISILKSNTQQSCTRDQETRKRVAKAFQEQAQAMQTRAIVPHDINCTDPVTCTKRKCFKWEPDKIVSDSYEVKRK